MKSVIMRLLLGVVCVALIVAAPAPSQLRRHRFVSPHMGTEFRLVLYADSVSRATDASQAAFKRIAALEATLSDYREESEVTRLARHHVGEFVAVSDDLFRVLSRAVQIARASGGAFDPTVGPVSKLWRRARRTSEMPAQAEIESAREAVGYDGLALDEHTRGVRLRAFGASAGQVRLTRGGIRLDLGGIGKGFAADEAAAVLRSYGIHRALIAAGGDVVAIGSPPDTDGWTVAVVSLDSPGGAARRIGLRDQAVSTSGDREQWLGAGAVRYSHIIDPRTGWPIAGMTSVTVVAATGADADALATAVAVLGPEEGLRLIDRENGAAAFVQRIRAERMESFMSRRWKSLVSH